MSTALQEAINEIVDARLAELGIITPGEDAAPTKASGKAAGKKASSKKAAPAVTVETVKEKLLAYVTKNGKPAAVKLLKSFGAAKVPDLEESDYAAIVEKIDASLEGGDEDDSSGDDDMFG